MSLLAWTLNQFKYDLVQLKVSIKKIFDYKGHAIDFTKPLLKIIPTDDRIEDTIWMEVKHVKLYILEHSLQVT